MTLPTDLWQQRRLVLPAPQQQLSHAVFQDAGTHHAHDGSTRSCWVASTLDEILAEPHPDMQTPSPAFCRVIVTLMDTGDGFNERPAPQFDERPLAGKPLMSAPAASFEEVSVAAGLKG